MEENKNLSSNDELMDDSMDAVAGGNGGKGWTEQEKQRVRNYCSNFLDPEGNFKKIITKYKTFDKFYKSIPKEHRGFCDPE